MRIRKIYITLFLGLIGLGLVAQDFADQAMYFNAYDLVNNRNYSEARNTLKEVLKRNPQDSEALFLLARTHSWMGYYNQARKEFNKITSVDRKNKDAWVSAIKNELYAKNLATALGLANKALFYLEEDAEIDRLKALAVRNIENKDYPELELMSGTAKLNQGLKSKNSAKGKSNSAKKVADKVEKKEKKNIEKVELKNMVGVNNSFTVFDIDRDPTIRSSISFKRKTKIGSIIPKINYNNRSATHGIQYDLDMYPKFSKTFYAYLNYGYSNAVIYPNHKVGGDLYANLPGPYEVSGGARFASTKTRSVFSITNSLGMYKGNYYFSLRSYITPRPGNLTRVSGNVLVRKYFRDGENFMGLNFGMGYSPELRQLTDGDEVLAETLLYIESQRLSLQYKFSPRKSLNIYTTQLGVARQEIASDSGNFFWAVSAGLTYQVKF